MLDKEITFDRFVRGLLVVLGFAAGFFLLRFLTPVLLPFFVAWVIAYMLYPIVTFLQYRCRLRSRVLCIILSLLLLLLVLVGVLMLVVPGVISEAGRLASLLTQLTTEYLGDTQVTQQINLFVQRYIRGSSVVELVSQDKVQTVLQAILQQAWGLLSQTIGFLIGILGLFVIVLYMFFLLLDYEQISNSWIKMVPRRQRPFMQQLVADVEQGMNSYFRGQTLVALLVGVLFAIGFSIIGLPIAVGLGLFIGVLNLVPYLQILGFLPALLCVTMRSVDTGESFWWVLFWTLVVFAVVQAIQDFILVPRIMGKAMGLNPAVILLSLSVWGALLGFIGLIIALPLTTLCISYYRRYVLGDDEGALQSGKAEEKG